MHTSNIVFCDVNNKTQGAFTQDFPIKDAVSPSKSQFADYLLRYLQKSLPLTLHSEIGTIIDTYDFSSARVHLVASVPGSFQGLSDILTLFDASIKIWLQVRIGATGA